MTVMVAAALYSHLAAAQPEVKDLRCENLGSPLGIDQPQPRLSWRLAPGARGLLHRVPVAAGKYAHGTRTVRNPPGASRPILPSVR